MELISALSLLLTSGRLSVSWRSHGKEMRKSEDWLGLTGLHSHMSFLKARRVNFLPPSQKQKSPPLGSGAKYFNFYAKFRMEF